MFERTKFSKGEHHLQLSAKAKLEEMGYTNVDAMEANSLLFANGKQCIQLHAKAKLEEMVYENVNVMEATSLLNYGSNEFVEYCKVF